MAPYFSEILVQVLFNVIDSFEKYFKSPVNATFIYHCTLSLLLRTKSFVPSLRTLTNTPSNFFPHQCLPTVHRSLSPPTNANILTTLLSNLFSALPVQDAKWAGTGGRPTIFIVTSQNSPGFIWKLARRSGRFALFQAADVTALAWAKSLIGISGGRTEAGCAEDDMCMAEREGYML